jgi:hypothetical protein
MKKYKVYYQLGYQLGIGEDWQQKTTAETPEQAYREFVKKVGAFPRAVNVEKGFLGFIDVFDDHVEEAEKRIEEEKAQTGKHPQESADKENSNFDQPKIHAKLEDISATSTTEKLLLNIALTQEKQFQELEKLNYKLWSFWIFFIGLPILAWIIIAVNS